MLLGVTLAAFGLPVWESIRLIAEGAFGSSAGLARTLVKTTPLLITALGMVIAWRAGIYNIGGEGQFLVGALGGAWIARELSAWPGLGLKPAILLATFMGGALWAMVAGWLMVKRNVQVVISTILLNFVAMQFFLWSVSGPLREAKGQLPQTDRLSPEHMLHRIDPQNDLHTGVFLALALVPLVFALLFLTRAGFRMRLVGENPRAARANRIPPARSQMLAIALSGGLCGLAAGVEYLGMTGQLAQGFSRQVGFLAIPVALLGSLHPVGTLFSATYFGGLFAGTENLARFSALGTSLLFVVQGVAVLGFIGIKTWVERRRQWETTDA